MRHLHYLQIIDLPLDDFRLCSDGFLLNVLQRSIHLVQPGHGWVDSLGVSSLFPTDISKAIPMLQTTGLEPLIAGVDVAKLVADGVGLWCLAEGLTELPWQSSGAVVTQLFLVYLNKEMLEIKGKLKDCIGTLEQTLPYKCEHITFNVL